MTPPRLERASLHLDPRPPRDGDAAPPVLFAPAAGRAFGERVAAALGVPLAALEEREFPDGESKVRPLVPVRGRDVFVVQSVFRDAEQGLHERLCRLLFLIGALVDASAASVTAVVPYLAYARKDSRTKPRDPVTTRYVAALFESVGTQRIVTLDVHNPAAFQNAHRCRAEHLEARLPFADRIASLAGSGEVAVVSPDAGGLKRAERFREALARRIGRKVATAVVEKHRSAGVVSGGAVAGELRGRTAVIFDDMISTGTTLARATRACRDSGAERVLAAATHGLLTGAASELLAGSGLEQVFVTNTVPQPAGLVSGRLEILDAGPLVADAIRRIHTGGSLVELLEED